MPIKINKKSIKDAARSSKINGFTLKEIERSLEQDAIAALRESGIKDGTFYINETGVRGDVDIDKNGNMKMKITKKSKVSKKSKNKKRSGKC